MTSQSDDNSDTMLPKYVKDKKQRLRSHFAEKNKEDESDDEVESDSSSDKEKKGKNSKQYPKQ
jgi:hypothetical protein